MLLRPAFAYSYPHAITKRQFGLVKLLKLLPNIAFNGLDLLTIDNRHLRGAYQLVLTLWSPIKVSQWLVHGPL